MTGWIFFPLIFFFFFLIQASFAGNLGCLLLDMTTAAARAVQTIPSSVCSIFACPEKRKADSEMLSIAVTNTSLGRK